MLYNNLRGVYLRARQFWLLHKRYDINGNWLDCVDNIPMSVEVWCFKFSVDFLIKCWMACAEEALRLIAAARGVSQT